MVTAIMEIIDAIIGDPGGRALSAILGIVSLIAGLIFLRRPGESLLAIVIVAGIFLVAEGVIRIVRAFGSDRRGAGGASSSALIDAIVGIVILAWPEHRARHPGGVLRHHDARARHVRDRHRLQAAQPAAPCRTRRRSRPRPRA